MRTGLVLAAAALAGHQLVPLPIIFHNLVQQIVAGVVDAFRDRGRRERTPAALFLRKEFEDQQPERRAHRHSAPTRLRSEDH
jgi:hypothetical protein